jgi:hypothetical protein
LNCFQLPSIRSQFIAVSPLVGCREGTVRETTGSVPHRRSDLREEPDIEEPGKIVI